MIEENREVICKMQAGNKMYASWCDLVQYDELCGKCPHSEKRDKSKYQESREKKENE